jgi:hypothetical protein
MLAGKQGYVVRYEVQLNRNDRCIQFGSVEARNDVDAYEAARTWANSLNIPLEGASLIVKNAGGKFKSFGPGKF